MILKLWTVALSLTLDHYHYLSTANIFFILCPPTVVVDLFRFQTNSKVLFEISQRNAKEPRAAAVRYTATDPPSTCPTDSHSREQLLAPVHSYHQ